MALDASEKATEARLMTKQGLNTGTHAVAAVTQTVHNSTLGAVCAQEGTVCGAQGLMGAPPLW